jgi:ADP-ribosylglycohydrolase
MGQTEMFNALVALSVGDASGENIMKILPPKAPGFYKAGNVADERNYPATDTIQWPWTDDTSTAIVVYRHLRKNGTIKQAELAKELAINAKLDPQRGYGKGTARLLYTYLYDAENWRDHSENWWGPKQGSKGNGSAMHDAIIGPFFDRDYNRIRTEARASAEVTHFHIDAIAGSIAVAIAAAAATYGSLDYFWNDVLFWTPKGELHDRIASIVPSKGDSPETTIDKVWSVVGQVGNGKDVTALDTVPFAIWQAYQALAETRFLITEKPLGAKGITDIEIQNRVFELTMQSIIEVGGDTDTVGAIVGGIIGNKVAPPQEWIDRTEPLPKDIAL